MIVDNLKLIAAVLVALTTIGGSYLAFESRVTTIAKVQVEPVSQLVNAIDKRVRLAELRDLHQKALDDYYHWKDLHNKYPNDREIKESLDRAKKRVEELERRIRELEKEIEEDQ